MQKYLNFILKFTATHFGVMQLYICVKQKIMNTKHQILDCVETVFSVSENSKLKAIVFELLDNELTFLSKCFECSKTDALLISNIFCLNLESEWVSLSDLKSHFDCSIINLIRYNDHFISLLNSSVLDYRDSQEFCFINAETEFKCSIETMQIITEKKHIERNEVKEENSYTFIEEMYKLLKRRDIDNDSNRTNRSEQIFTQMKFITKKYKSHLVNKFFESNNFDDESKLIFSNVLWRALAGYRELQASSIFEKIYGENSKSIEKIQEFMLKKHFLIENKFIDTEKGRFNESYIVVSNKSVKLLKASGFEYYTPSKTAHLHIIKTEEIHIQKLFYSQKSTEQIQQLRDSIIPGQLEKIQEKLVHKGMSKGLTTIFYGPPGTGKTETVLQIAKRCKRNIMKVDISETKSMWFGESQKLVKGIFDDYRDLCKENENTPILFFNEADAIFTTRSNNHHQTQNEIQNILLEELENFEGILMATTNFENNLDKAFERRFLFKIKLEKPNTKAKAKIWIAKIAELSENEAKILAEKYDFSGGQINNIVRKKEMYEVLHNKNISFGDIINYCEEETYTKEEIKKVGFKN